MKKSSRSVPLALSTISLWCALGSLIMFPLAFAPTGFAVGLAALVKDEDYWGLAGMILNIICGIVGLLLGVRAGLRH